MNDEQTERLFSTLGRIEQKIDSHLADDESVHDRQDAALTELYEKTGVVEKTQARHRGIALGVTGLMSVIMAYLNFGGD